MRKGKDMGCMRLSQQEERREKGREEGMEMKTEEQACRIRTSVETGKSQDADFLCSYRLCNELTAIYVNASETWVDFLLD